MGFIFSKEKKDGKPKVTAHDRAMLELRVHRDKVYSYKKKLEGVLEREQELAKAALQRGDRKKALVILKKRKFQENLLEKAESQLGNLDEMVTCHRTVYCVHQHCARGVCALRSLTGEDRLGRVCAD